MTASITSVCSSAWGYIKKSPPVKYTMASLRPKHANKPVENIHPNNLPDANEDHLTAGLKALVNHSSKHSDVSQGIHAPMSGVMKLPWVHDLIPGIEKLAAAYHIGNFVVVRGTNERIFESMPIYARVGMHLVFYGKRQVELLQIGRIEHLLREESIKQGVIYDSHNSTKSIASFARTYSIKTDELENPDLNSYKSFNDFFYRKLRPGARPVQNAEDPTGFCSAADCRLTVYQTIDLAKQFWVKGKNFDIPHLLNLPPTSDMVSTFQDASLAIFRLAPADYHRFHCPLDGVVGGFENIPGQYYTVNPQAVNEPDFDVFTANTRSVLYLTHSRSGLPVAFVAIGALLVGSIKWTGGGEKGKVVKRGDELGYFAYGGSTIVVVFPKGVIEFDKDIVENSKEPVETMMKVGYSLGCAPAAK
jgi:phosphatidylserine decarboxylase